MNETAQETTAEMALLVEHEPQMIPALVAEQQYYITHNEHNRTTSAYSVSCYSINIPVKQFKSAGFGLHPFSVHTALICCSGTRPGPHL